MNLALTGVKNLPAPADDKSLKDPRNLSAKQMERLRFDVGREAPLQQGIISRLSLTLFQRYGTNAYMWEIGYVLTGALAGIELSEEQCSKITISLLQMMDVGSAFGERRLSPGRPSPEGLWKLEEFQEALARLYSGLTSAGVTEKDARIVSGNVAKAAEVLVRDRVFLHPIPPAQEPPYTK
jgi:hypothetical protein